MKKIKITLLILMLLYTVGCSTEGQDTKLYNDVITIAVSIPPEKAFVEAIAGEYAEVVTMIPPGNSPANYQPTTKQMLVLSSADIYYTIGVPAEISFIQPRIKDFNKDIVLVDLFEEVEKIYQPRYFDDETNDNHDHTGYDPHIWLSPKRVEILISSIADSLSEIDPTHKDIYLSNAENYIKELKELDKLISNTVISGSSFIIYHPSLGYFANDYDLNMIAIEASGKEATAQDMEYIIDYANEEAINVIFYQVEFSSKQAEIIANEINGTVKQIDILSEDYIDNMKVIASTIAEYSTKDSIILGDEESDPSCK